MGSPKKLALNTKNARLERSPSALYFVILFLGLWSVSFIGTSFLNFTPLDIVSNGLISASQAAEAVPSNPIVNFASSNPDSPWFIGSRADHILLVVLVLLAIFLSKKPAGPSRSQRIPELICIYLGIRYLY